MEEKLKVMKILPVSLYYLSELGKACYNAVLIIGPSIQRQSTRAMGRVAANMREVVCTRGDPGLQPTKIKLAATGVGLLAGFR